MKELQIAKMTDHDIREVMAVERWVFTTPWTESMFKQEVRGVFNSRAVTARLGQRLVGYRIAWFIEDEVHLVNIAVHPDFQSRGVGSRLLTHLLEEALTADKRIVTLEVRESNASAQRFYRSFHFHTIGIRKGYYSDNREDALLMALDLEEYVERKDDDAGSSQTG